MPVVPKKSKRLWWIFLVVAFLAVAGTVSLISFSTFGNSSTAAETGDASGEEASVKDTEKSDSDAGEKGKEGVEKKGEEKEGEEKEPEIDPVPVEISEVKSKPISSYLSTTANLEAENEAQVLAEIEGLVVQLLVEEGDWVNKGDILARLDEGDKRINLRKAALKVQSEQNNFERVQRMQSSSLISQEEFDKVDYAFQVARQEQEAAAYLLSRTEIRAPFAGIVSERLVKEGARVKPSDPVFSLVSRASLIAKIFLPEKDVLDLQIGDPVMMALNAIDDAPFRGEISLISPVVDPNTGTVKVTVKVPKIPGNVRPGSFVTVNIVRETHTLALTVPRKALIRDLQENFVFVVNGEEASKRKVVIGFEENGYVEILSGLEDGERIVTVGQGGLKDGTPVEIIDA